MASNALLNIPLHWTDIVSCPPEKTETVIGITKA